GRNRKHNYCCYIFDRTNKNMNKKIKKIKQIEKSNLSKIDKEEELSKEYEGNVQRAHMGKTENGDVSMQLMDSKGKPRIRMVVDENDIPKIEFLDEKGEITYKLDRKSVV